MNPDLAGRPANDAVRGPEPGLPQSLDATGWPSIAYRQFGSGPGLVILHGMMETSADHVDLARSLSTHFTVYVSDRRGFGETRFQAFAADLDDEAADLGRLLEATGAEAVMGISVGALVALRAMAISTQIRAAVLFEPPLSIDGSAPLEWTAQVKRRLADGDRIGAMVGAMVGAKMGPPAFERMPFWLLKLMTRLLVLFGGRNSPAPDVKLAPTLAHDADLVIEAADTHADYAGITTPVLLLGASDSPGYFGVALDCFDGILPNATRTLFSGRDHQVTGNRARGGDTELVAAAVAPFSRYSPPQGGAGTSLTVGRCLAGAKQLCDAYEVLLFLLALLVGVSASPEPSVRSLADLLYEMAYNRAEGWRCLPNDTSRRLRNRADRLDRRVEAALAELRGEEGRFEIDAARARVAAETGELIITSGPCGAGPPLARLRFETLVREVERRARGAAHGGQQSAR